MKHETWRYLPGGTVKHALSDPYAGVSGCGLEVRRSWDWYGTGSQDEYETLAARPACKRCMARGYRP